jgi:uncharacterized protein (TIGR00369 family)
MPTLEALQADLDRVAAPWIRELGLQLTEIFDDGVAFTMPVTPPLVHGGGVLCGQALMAAADTAMIIALSSALGGFKPMTTVQLSCSFLKAVPGATPQVGVRCRLLRKGRNLAFGEVTVSLPDGSTAAHATTTYAIL